MTVEATQSSGWKVGTFTESATDIVGPVTLTYSKSAGTVLPFGTTTVTVTATDAAGNHSSATFTVTVRDTTAPVITATDLTVEATSAAGAKVFFSPSVSDAVGGGTVTTSIASGTTFSIGVHTVTVTATDGHGNLSTTTFQVTVQDTTAPKVTVPANVTVEATSSAGATASYGAASATDAVGVASLSYSPPPPGGVFPIGVTTVIVTATDAAGNHSSATFTVTVRDTTAPVITAVNGNVTTEGNTLGGAIVTYTVTPAATDAVGGVTFSYSKASGSVFSVGTTTVTLTATDGVGNHSSKSFTVTVKDTTAPVITAPNMTVEATQSSGWKVGTFTATASDVVGPVTLTYSKSPGSVLPFGTTTVTVTATDASGNHSSATFTVLVQDTTAPVITAADLIVEATGPAGAKVYYTPSASDAVGPVTLSVSVASGTTFAIGSTPVTVTATDGHGNVAHKTFNVVVQDTTAPAINAPLYLVVNATSLAGAIVTYPAFATDAVGPITYTYSIPSGSLFPLSFSPLITFTATDAYGNTSTGSFTVFVHDVTPPVITSVSGNLTVEGNTTGGAIVTYAAATATDPIVPVQITYSKPSGSFFAVGTTTVWVTATDEMGNVTKKTFKVTVIDTTPPVITSVSPNLTIEATSSYGAAVTYVPAIATDIVGPVTISYSKSSGSTFALGTTTVTVTAKDAAGNTATRTFTITVRDTTPPVITASNMVVEATGPSGAKVAHYNASATDAVGPVTLTYSIAPNSTFGIGPTTVTVTATDGAGNHFAATFTVTVKDTTPPAISSVSNLTIEATSAAGAAVTFPTITATDAVGPVTITYSQGSGTIFALGTTTVTVTATDSHGNVSVKSFTITVRDTTPPVITSISGNITVARTSSAGAIVTFPAATATDVAGPVTITYTTPSGPVSRSGTLFAVGTTTVTVTATDAAGNVTKRTFKVTVT